MKTQKLVQSRTDTALLVYGWGKRTTDSSTLAVFFIELDMVRRTMQRSIRWN